ncbi:MAG: outer membrane beta-barrel protein [Muribaculaceae bacterium]|nr:outer membrane beta-barrel protein [Muribaculaceae bacterium]
MKKILFALVAAIGIGAGVAQAQAPAQLSISYGGYTQMDATDCHDGWHHVNNAWGALNAGVNFRVAPSFWIGPSYTFSSTDRKGPDSGKIAYHAIMLNGRYDYYRNRIVKMYAHLGMGVVISHMQPYKADSYNKTYCAYQIVPVGAEVGISRSFSIFGELGFGAQGLLQVGCHINI